MPFIAAVVTVRDSTGAGGRVCFSGANLLWDCASTAYMHDWRGYETDGMPVCASEGVCGVDVASP